MRPSSSLVTNAFSVVNCVFAYEDIQQRRRGVHSALRLQDAGWSCRRALE